MRKENKEFKELINKRDEQNNILLNNLSVMMNKLLKTEEERESAKTETKEIKKELKDIPEIILVLVSEDDNKKLYISRINKKQETKVLQKFKNLKFKFLNKFQTYNSVVNCNKIIEEYSKAGIIKTNRNYIYLDNITVEDFINKIKDNA
jgi:hypothetical protein